jgi:uncharacterized protein
MEFNEAPRTASLLISGYGNKSFRIGDKKLDGNLLLTSKKSFSLDVENFETITFKDLSPIFEDEGVIEIILFGTGESIQFVPKDIEKQLISKKIAFDMMDTGAAARTFNVLQMEGRRVAAALIAVE